MTIPPAKLNSMVNFWHLLLGHPLPKHSICKLVQYFALPHVTCRENSCEYCAKEKFRCRLRSSLTFAFAVGKLHVDTKGFLNTESVNVHNYFVTITEQLSRLVSGCPIRFKPYAAPDILRVVNKL